MVADLLAELRVKLSGQQHWIQYDHAEALTLVLTRLKEASSDTAVEFVLVALRLIRQEASWTTHVLNQAAGQVLRRKLEFSEDQVVEMLELAAVPNSSFPFRGILKAVEAVPMSPRLAERLRLLRPCITDFLGGGEARELHARIDNLLDGPAPQTALDTQGAWSKIVFDDI